MTTRTTGQKESPASPKYLLLAFELGERTWKLGFVTGLGERPRVREIAGRAVDRLADEIARAKRRLNVAAETPVVSCFEAGRDGFWLHRYLVAHGISNHVVDSASIEVSRRARHAKTDRLDLGSLLTLLARYLDGDRRVWRVVHVPGVDDEDARHLHRARETVQQDRTRLINRLKGLLMTQGVQMTINADFLERLDAVRLWNGAPMPCGLRQRLTRVWAQLELLNTQLQEIEETRARLQANTVTAASRQVQQLQTLRGVGSIGAWLLTSEIFAWREIRNGRALGALVGLVPSPYQSGDISHDQGITRAGNRHVRRMMIQLAWSWIRYQPGSALTQWYRARFGTGRRLRRIGIVALARKLLIALWRYLETGVIPDGAILKPATS